MQNHPWWLAALPHYVISLCRYVHLELLEGVVAFHSGEQQLAKQRLQAAQERWQKLQVGGLGGCTMRWWGQDLWWAVE
jgi:hypothetical protein